MNDKNYLRLGQIYQFLQKGINFKVNRISDFESLVCNDFDVNYQLPNDSLICQNNPEYSGNTALHFFAESYKSFSSFRFYSQYLKVLIRSGADVTVKNNDGFTPLLLAFNHRATEDKSLSLHDFNGRNTVNVCFQNGISYFHMLCTTNNVEVVELFLKSGVDINERVNNDHPDYPGYTPLHFAVHFSCIKIIKLLISHGADLNVSDARGISSMHLIAKNYLESNIYYDDTDSNIKEFLKNTILNRGLKNLPDNLGFSRLHYGCLLVKKECQINKYFDKNIDINSPIKFDSPIWPGRTPLHLAAQSRNLKTVTFLLKNGANILAEDANGTTALHILSVEKQLRLDEIINILSSEKQHQFSKLKFTDGTNLLDIMLAIRETQKMKKKIIKNNLKNVNTFIPRESLLWPGYNLVHLEALFDDINYGFVEQGVDFSMINAEGMSPLHLAFRFRRYTLIREILKFIPKMPKNVVDQDNLSHLHIACGESCEEKQTITLKAVECILKNGADPNISTINDLTLDCSYEKTIIKSGTTPLHFAVYKKNVEVANMLMSYGANPCLSDSAGVTPFQLALIKLTKKETSELFIALFGKSDNRPIEKLVAQMLESHGKNLMTGEIGVSILRTALRILDKNYIRFLKQMVKEFDQENRYEELGLTRLQVACAVGDFNLFKKALKSGADVNAHIAFDSSLWPGDTALHILLRKPKQSSYYNFVELLLKHGADITLKNAENLTPFHLNQELLEQEDSFLSKYSFTSVNPANSEGLSHFHLCCMKGNTSFIKEFLKSGADVNTGVNYFAEKYAGYTPLHFVVENMHCDNNTELIELLLSYGADPHKRNADGLDSYHLGLIQNNNQRKFLIRCPKIDIYASNVFGDTALDVILQDCNPLGEEVVIKKVKNMLQWGYELSYKDMKGKTALHKSTNPDIIKILLSVGADINIRDDNGKTCVQYVSADNKRLRKVFDEHVQLLQAAGLHIDNLNKIDRNISVRNMSKEVEKVNLSENLKKLIDPSFSADYFFSEKFVVDYKTMPVSVRQNIYFFCLFNDFCDFESLSPLIMLQFWKTRARTRLFKPAESVLEALIGNIGVLIPDCLEPILNFLSNDDLMNLVRVKNTKLEFLPLPEN